MIFVIETVQKRYNLDIIYFNIVLKFHESNGLLRLNIPNSFIPRAFTEFVFVFLASFGLDLFFTIIINHCWKFKTCMVGCP